jgi:hypothetical protein
MTSSPQIQDQQLALIANGVSRLAWLVGWAGLATSAFEKSVPEQYSVNMVN